MAKIHNIKVIGGDIPKVKGRMFKGFFGGLVITTQGTVTKPLGVKIKIKKDIKNIMLLDEERQKKLLGTVGWGFLGAVTTGGLGMLAGVLAGGNKREMVVAFELNNGDKFIATMDGKAWKALIPYAYS